MLESRANVFMPILSAEMYWLFGEYDASLRVLVTLFLLNFISGFLYAILNKKFKSKKVYDGIFKFFIILCIIATLHQFIKLDGIEKGMAGAKAIAIWGFILYYTTSIMEIAIRAGVPIPDTIKDFFNKNIQINK